MTDKVVNVPAGDSPPDVYLNRAPRWPLRGCSGNVRGAAERGHGNDHSRPACPGGSGCCARRWYLQFSPNPAYTGQVRIGFRLTSDLGASNTGTVIYNLNYDPPSWLPISMTRSTTLFVPART